MEKGGSVGRTRPHSAKGLAVPARLAGPCGRHTLPGLGATAAGRDGCWLGWQQLPGHRVAPSGAPVETWSAWSPAPPHTVPLSGAMGSRQGHIRGNMVPLRRLSPNPPPGPGEPQGHRTCHLLLSPPWREDVTVGRRPNFLIVREEGGTEASVPGPELPPAPGSVLGALSRQGPGASLARAGSPAALWRLTPSPSPRRAPTPSGRTSTPRPPSCTPS